MSKSRIAVIIALLLAAPAGVVALAQSASEATEPTQTQEIQATVAEPAAPPAEAVTVTETTVVEQTTVVAAPAEPRRMFQAVQSNTFPQGSTNSDDAAYAQSPRQLAYLERLEQQRGNMIALGSSFPAGSYGDEAGAYQHLPRQIAYLNGAEQTRLASATSAKAPQPMARSEVQPAEPVARSTDDSTLAGSAEVAMIR